MVHMLSWLLNVSYRLMYLSIHLSLPPDSRHNVTSGLALLILQPLIVLLPCLPAIMDCILKLRAKTSPSFLRLLLLGIQCSNKKSNQLVILGVCHSKEKLTFTWQNKRETKQNNNIKTTRWLPFSRNRTSSFWKTSSYMSLESLDPGTVKGHLLN